MRYGGERGIRTPDRGVSPYNGLANRRLQPLGHLSVRMRRDADSLYQLFLSLRSKPPQSVHSGCTRELLVQRARRAWTARALIFIVASLQTAAECLFWLHPRAPGAAGWTRVDGASPYFLCRFAPNRRRVFILVAPASSWCSGLDARGRREPLFSLSLRSKPPQSVHSGCTRELLVQ